MNPWVKRGLFSLLLLVVLCVVAIVGLLKGWHVKKYLLSDLEAYLRPDVEVFLPATSGPHPVIVGFHGCAGILDGNRNKASLYTDQGYAFVLVNSFRLRNADPAKVCEGLEVWGSERAGDVYAGLNLVRKDPRFIEDQIFILAWSHGAWAIMDALVFDTQGEIPPSLIDVPGAPFAGVQGMALIYPFCGFPAAVQNHIWGHSVPVKIVLVEGDDITPPADCRPVINDLKAAGLPVSDTTFTGVEHGFAEGGADMEAMGGIPAPKSEAELYALLNRFFKPYISRTEPTIGM